MVFFCDNCTDTHTGTFSHLCKYTGDRVAEVICPLDERSSFHYEWAQF